MINLKQLFVQLLKWIIHSPIYLFNFIGRVIEDTRNIILINKKMCQQVVDLNKELMKYRENPTKECMEDILGREIKWIDSTNFTTEMKRDWYLNAQSLLKNKVFVSLCGGVDKEGKVFNGEIVKDLIEEIAKRSQSYEQVQYLRSKIAGIELIRRLVTDIEDTSVKKETNQEPFGVI